MNLTDKLTITNEDNMALMARYPDKYFDLSIVDPPYGINAAKTGKVGGGKLAKVKDYGAKEWDKNSPNDEYFMELFRVSKNVIIWGANHFISSIPFDSPCWIVWDKNNTGNFADCELAWTSFETAVRKFKFTWNGMLQGDMKNKQIRIHPTEKPYQLYKFCLETYAKPTNKILDTHLGSGSIAIACHDYGYELTACELDKDYYDAAIKRIKTHLSQSKLDLTA